MSGIALAICLALAGASQPVTTTVECGNRRALAGPLRYVVVGSAPQLKRKVTGPVVRELQGVPAEPVDSFIYDGNGSVPIDGTLRMEVDPQAEVGIIEVSWTDQHGEWSYRQTKFSHPEHSSGARLSPSMELVDSLAKEGITTNVYLHGDTGAGMPSLPTMFSHLATWGIAKIELNGEPFLNPYGFPEPDWLGHTMVVEGVYQPDGSVRTVSGEIYSPMAHASKGRVETGDLEVHLAWSDERFPMTKNVPPLFEFFYHLVFEDVSMEILDNDEPMVLNPCRPLESKPQTQRK